MPNKHGSTPTETQPLPRFDSGVQQDQLATRELRDLQPEDVRRQWRVEASRIRTNFDNQQQTLDDKNQRYERDGQTFKMRMYIPSLRFFTIPSTTSASNVARGRQGNCHPGRQRGGGGRPDDAVETLDIALKITKTPGQERKQRCLQ